MFSFLLSIILFYLIFLYLDASIDIFQDIGYGEFMLH